MTQSSLPARNSDQPGSDAAGSGAPPGPDNPLLKAAWQRQQVYSNNAARCQARFVALRTTLAVLSVFVVILSVLERPDWQCPTSTPWLDRHWECVGHGLIDNALLILPITISALLAFSIRFDRGHNWVLLRGNAETLKMEIYYYRTRTGPYDKNRDEQLAKRIKQLSEGMKGSPVHQSALSPYEAEPNAELHLGILIKLVLLIFGSILAVVSFVWNVLFQISERKKKPESATVPASALADPAGENPLQTKPNFFQAIWQHLSQQVEMFLGPKLIENYQEDPKFYSDLSGKPEVYLEERLEEQFNWYRRKAKILAHQLQKFQAGVYLFGGVGTLLAATDNYKGWVAVTTAFTGAFVNFLEFKRVEATLVGYNQAADTLYDIRAWWYSLPSKERENLESFGKLVENCEGTIRSENVSWLQDMQERLAQLYESSRSKPSDEGEDQPPDPKSQPNHTGQSPEEKPSPEKMSDGEPTNSDNPSEEASPEP